MVINGYRVRDWHQGEWNDATGTPLSECGWGHPTALGKNASDAEYDGMLTASGGDGVLIAPSPPTRPSASRRVVVPRCTPSESRHRLSTLQPSARS